MNLTYRFVVFLLWFGISISVNGQGISPGEKNEILFPGKSKKSFERLFLEFNQLLLKGEGTIQILHLGDSHIQADFFPGQVRKRLVSEIGMGCGARGLIFPYRVAKTNNPVDYFVKFSGKWESCRNVEVNKSCTLGLTGIMVRTHDSITDLTYHFREAFPGGFNAIKIYEDQTGSSFSFDFPGIRNKIKEDQTTDYRRFVFREYLADSLKIRITRKDTLNNYFTLYGTAFENGDAGIVYSSAGVNGAEVTSFLRCELLSGQVASLHPALVIVSLGTNDAYPVKFDKDLFINNYRELIQTIRKSDPELPILLTIPGDSYRKRRYINKNLPVLREAILQVANETNCAVWDFYTLMGGAKSIQRWFKAGLVAKDKLHFNKSGYIIQGNLLSDALIEAYSNFIDQRE